jgi:lipoprotein-anchoring transpeptidase ErfK/SrfK
LPLLAIIFLIVALLFLRAPPSSSILPTTPPIAVLPTPPPTPPLFHYIELIDGCGPYYDGVCVNMRSGPGTQYPVVMQLRDGIVLKVATTTVNESGTWYKIAFDGTVHYPERVKGGWYVNADYVRLFLDEGPVATTTGRNKTSSKRIVIDINNEILSAYDGDTLFMQQAISTGLELTPTALGTFSVIRKMPDSYMQGPIAGLSDQVYDLPGVPWDLYFTRSGAAIHGAYWHNHFGEPWSHGCVNLPPDQAKILYAWADLGTTVIVKQ